MKDRSTRPVWSKPSTKPRPPRKPKPQTIHDFDLDMLLGESSESIAEFLGVTVPTVDGWKVHRNRINGAPPLMAVRLLAIRHECDLSAIGGKEWEHFNFNRFGLFVPGFKTRIQAGELQMMFHRHGYSYQLERAAQVLQERIKALEAQLSGEIERAKADRAALWAIQKVQTMVGQMVMLEPLPRPTPPPAMA